MPEAVYVLAHFFAPFIPIAAEANCQFAAVGCEESENLRMNRNVGKASCEDGGLLRKAG